MYETYGANMVLGVLLLFLLHMWSTSYPSYSDDDLERAKLLHITGSDSKPGSPPASALQPPLPYHIDLGLPPPAADYSERQMTPSEGKYTRSHCTGVEPLGKYHTEKRPGVDQNAWERVTCHFRNLCFEPSTKKFVYYAAPGDSFNHSMALGAINPAWPKEAPLRWSPEVRNTAAPAHKLTSPDELYLPHLEYDASSPMHLVLDQFYPWFYASALFNLTGKVFRPLRVVPPSPLQGTCDADKNLESTCGQVVSKWLPAMLPGKTAIPTVESLGEMVCFDHAVVGYGVLSDHCRKGHGEASDRNDKTLHDCNQARAPILRAFRSHLASVMGLQLHPPTKVLVAVYTNGNIDLIKWAAQQPFEVWRVDDAALSTKEILEKMSRSVVCVMHMNSPNPAALFLPSNAALVVVHEGEDRTGWDLWKHMAWVRTSWTTSSKISSLVTAELQMYQKVTSK